MVDGIVGRAVGRFLRGPAMESWLGWRGPCLGK